MTSHVCRNMTKWPAIWMLFALAIGLAFGVAWADSGFYDVRVEGAVGDGSVDDTAAFQQALNLAAADGGGVVTIPTGQYKISATLVVPENVTLEGVWRAPSRARGKADGSTLRFVTNGVTTASIELRSSATIKGFAVWYPGQTGYVAYPWTIVGNGDHCTILDIMLINAWDAVDFGNNPCDYHYVNGLYGEALHKGLYLDQSTGGVVENVHWWVFDEVDKRLVLSDDAKALSWLNVNGTAFLVGNVQGQKAYNCFDIFYSVSWHFADFGHGTGNGVYTNIYPDVTPTAFLIEGVDEQGITVVNGFSFAEVEVADTNTGPVRFVSSMFNAADNADTQGFVTHSHVRLGGTGPVTFDGCHFSDWDHPRTEPADGSPAIDANCRSLIVTGCEFSSSLASRVAVKLGANIRAAVVSANRLRTGIVLDDQTGPDADVVVDLNAIGTIAKSAVAGGDEE